MGQGGYQGIFISDCEFFKNSVRHFMCVAQDLISLKHSNFIIVDLNTISKNKIQNFKEKNPQIPLYGVSKCPKKQIKFMTLLDGVFDQTISIKRILQIITCKQQNFSNYNLQDIKLLNALAYGYSDKEISDMHNIPLSMVKYYLRRLYRKLGVLNRVQAALAARQIHV